MIRKFGFLAFWLCLWVLPAHAADNSTRTIKLEWGSVEGATAYDLELKPTGKGSEDRKLVKKRVKDPEWSGNISNGPYQMRIRSVDDRGVPGDWSEPAKLAVQLPATMVMEPKHKTQIQSDEAETDKVRLKWREIPGAKSYKVELTSDDQKIKKSETTSDNYLKISLPVASGYQWKVTAIDADGQPGDEMSQPGFFVLLGKTLDAPKVEEPESKYVQKLNWNMVEKAENYSYLLMRQDSKGKWRLVEKQEKITKTQVDFKAKFKGGNYKLMVRSHGRLRKTSPYKQVEFGVHDGDRTPAAVEQAILRESIEKPSSFYAIASYLATQVSYQSKSYEENKVSAFSAIGGTGRLGVGFKPPGSSFGTFLIVDMGGFNILDKNYTFASEELHETYTFPLKVSVAQVSAGFFQKNLPLMIYNSSLPDGSKLSVSSVSNTGLHFGAKFWHPFSTKLGASLHGQGYYNASGSSPNGTAMVPTFSYEMGLMGTYRLSQRSMGFAGVTMRQDNSSFLAVDSKFLPTTISLQGTYVNFILEYAF